MVWWDGRRYITHAHKTMCAASVFVLVCESMCVCARTWTSGLYFYREQTKWKIEKKTLVAAATRMLFSSIFELRENEHTIHRNGRSPIRSQSISFSFSIFLIFVKFSPLIYLPHLLPNILAMTFFYSVFLSVVEVFSSWSFDKFLFYFPFCLRQIFCYSITFVLF